MQKNWKRAVAALALACIAVAWAFVPAVGDARGGATTALYTLVDLKGFPIVHAGRSNYIQSYAFSLNQRNTTTGVVQVVGNSFVQGRPGIDLQWYRITPTLWNVNANGSFSKVDLGLLDPEQEATATDVNDNGFITITTDQSLQLVNGHPFLPGWVWSAQGGRQQLKMTANQAEAVALNNAGDIAGRDHSNTIVGASWHNSTPAVEILLGAFKPSDIDENGVMLGVDADGAAAIAWFDEFDALWVEPLSGSGWLGNAMAISPNGNYVAGSIEYGGAGAQAFVWKVGDADVTLLGKLGGAGSAALGVNDSGHVVGWSDTGNAKNPRAAFLYKNGKLQNLNSLTAMGSGYRLLEAAAINNAGHIVGFLQATVKGSTEERAYVLIPK